MSEYDEINWQIISLIEMFLKVEEALEMMSNFTFQNKKIKTQDRCFIFYRTMFFISFTSKKLSEIFSACPTHCKQKDNFKIS